MDILLEVLIDASGGQSCGRSCVCVDVGRLDGEMDKKRSEIE